jgi:hypothetical protein
VTGTDQNLPSQSAKAEPPQRPVISAEEFRKDWAYLTVVMNTFLSGYLLRLYKEFDGDFIQVLVLANIAHHNILSLARQVEFDMEILEKLLQAGGDALGGMRPCNAFSISEALNIPRETVRRKVAILIQKGWLHRNERKELFVTRLPAEVFVDFNVALLNDLLRTADLLRHRLWDDGREAASDDTRVDNGRGCRPSRV